MLFSVLKRVDREDILVENIICHEKTLSKKETADSRLRFPFENFHANKRYACFIISAML